MNTLNLRCRKRLPTLRHRQVSRQQPHKISVLTTGMATSGARSILPLLSINLLWLLHSQNFNSIPNRANLQRQRLDNGCILLLSLWAARIALNGVHSVFVKWAIALSTVPSLYCFCLLKYSNFVDWRSCVCLSLDNDGSNWRRLACFGLCRRLLLMHLMDCEGCSSHRTIEWQSSRSARLTAGIGEITQIWRGLGERCAP